MAEATETRTGSPADRKASIVKTAAVSMAGGVAYATADWLLDGHSVAGWYLAPPPRELVDMWIALALPTMHTIARIFNNYLAKAEKDSQ